MTCIAVKDGVMAADSMITGQYISAGIKLYRQKSTIVGFAGNQEQSLVFVDWFFDRSNRKPDLSNEDDWHALVLSKSGIEYWSTSLRPIQLLEKFAAIGSGAPFAIGAMEMGASAKKAVEVACKRAEGCGGPVITMRLR